MMERIFLFVFILALLSNLLRPYYISKFLSVILISTITFFLGHFMRFEWAFYISFIAVFSLTFYGILKRGFEIDRDNESVFLISFAYFLFLRSLVPDILDAEKFMDMAFMNSVLNADRLPPNDPFFAGGRIDFYYYFGHVIAAVITKMCFVPPEYGYNIAMAFVSAVSFSILHGFLRDVGIGKIGLIPLISGPIYSFYDLLKTLSSGKLPGFLFYWNSTRIIPDSKFKYVITEFPYFSFIHADLHAHVIAIPIKILFIALLYRFYKEKELGLEIPLLNFVLFATNSWDAPAFFLLSSLILLKGRRFDLLILSALFIVIFKLELNTGAPIFFSSEFSEHLPFLSFWGLFLVLLYYNYLEEIKRKPLLILPAVLFFVSPAFIFLPLILFAVRRREFEDLLVAIGALFIIICEFVTIDWRINTYFKFYLIALVLFLHPTAKSLEIIYKKRKPVALLLIALMLTYPVIATPVRHYKAELTLDGLNFMREQNPGDYYAVKWLYGKNVVIVEGVDSSYSYSGRIAVFSGNPTVIAWPSHEIHWRNNTKEVIERINDVKKLYKGSCDDILEIAKKYNISYIVCGRYEKERYSCNFSCLKKVFDMHGTEIYSLNTIE